MKAAVAASRSRTLRSWAFKQRVVRARKGRGSYRRDRTSLYNNRYKRTLPGDGSFLADLLGVTRDRTVFAAIEFMKALRFVKKIKSVPVGSARIRNLMHCLRLP